PATPSKLNSEADSDTVLPDTYNKSKPKTIMEQEQWSIFPNPAQDYLEVTLPIWKDDRATLHLLNSAGKAVLEEQLDVLNGQSHWMNLAKVARGVYYLKLQTIEGQHLTKKVIVDK
ncbi:MAG: T9SS type A sorting domain-containing protein, partial [Saprospiraceae bacterium]|nr:T9SS type A sorting domain-containing protein [Saprospiraceae bacterium]